MGSERLFAVRTVRRGAVRIGGVTYRPRECHLAYDGRLDGLRFAFGRYLTAGRYEPFVGLWGTETAFLDRSGRTADDGPHVVDGSLPWMTWDAMKGGRVDG